MEQQSSGAKPLSVGFNDRENIDRTFEMMEEHWSKKGITDKYSTGFPLIDSYLGGGYGVHGLGEVIVLHSGSKCFKSLMGVQFIKDPFEKGEKIGLLVIEGGFERFLGTLKGLYYKNGVYDDFYKYYEKNKDNLFQVSRAFVNSKFGMDEVVAWMQARRAEGTKIFLIDPVGYLADYSGGREASWDKEKEFMKHVVNFADDTESTVIMIQHNVKDAMSGKYREEALGGSVSYSKSPTKVIEIRQEGILGEGKGVGVVVGKMMSMEFYMGRDVPDKRTRPIVFQVISNPDGKSRSIFVPIFQDQVDADNNLNPNMNDAKIRKVWDGQVKAYESL